MSDTQTVYLCATDIVETFVDGNVDENENTIDCVVTNLYSIIEAYNNDDDTYAEDLIGNMSTYIQVDMNEEELEEFTAFVDSKIDEYCLC